MTFRHLLLSSTAISSTMAVLVGTLVNQARAAAEPIVVRP